MISISRLNITLNDNAILDQIDLVIGKGEIFGITGLNGSGKTILLKIMATLMAPTAGKVEISGFDSVKDRKRIRPLIGYMPDSGTCEDALSIMEYLDFFISMSGNSRGDYIAPLEELLHAMNLKHIADVRMSDLSSGIRRKVSFVRSLVHNPSVLLLDDPECGMDWDGLETMASILKERSGSGTAIAVSSRSMTFLNRVAHRIGVLHEGKLRWTFPAGVENRKTIQERITALTRGKHEPGTG